MDVSTETSGPTHCTVIVVVGSLCQVRNRVSGSKRAAPTAVLFPDDSCAQSAGSGDSAAASPPREEPRNARRSMRGMAGPSRLICNRDRRLVRTKFVSGHHENCMNAPKRIRERWVHRSEAEQLLLGGLGRQNRASLKKTRLGGQACVFFQPDGTPAASTIFSR